MSALIRYPVLVLYFLLSLGAHAGVPVDPNYNPSKVAKVALVTCAMGVIGTGASLFAFSQESNGTHASAEHECQASCVAASLSFVTMMLSFGVVLVDYLTRENPTNFD